MRRPSDDEVVELGLRLAAFFARRVLAQDVGELVNETLVRVLDSESSRDPARGTIVQFTFGVVVRDVLRDHFRDKERLWPASSDDVPGSESSYEWDVVTDFEVKRLCERARRDPVVALLVERELSDEDSIGELWRALEFSPTEIRNARRRLARLVDDFDE